MAGYYRMHRGWMDNAIFQGDEFSRRDAWVWMIERAAFKPTQHRIGDRIVDVPRGAFMATIRELAQQWGWSKSRVERFLRAMQEASMIRSESGTGTGTSKRLITICNYEKYQADADRSGTIAGQLRDNCGTTAGHKRNKGKEGKEGNISIGASPVGDSPAHEQPDLIAEQIPPPQPKAPEYPEDFQRLWEAYPRRSGSNDKRKALKAWTARLRAGHSPGEILAGVERYARWCEATGKVGTEMVKQAATFLGPADPPHFAEAWAVPGAKDPPPDSAPAAEQPIWADALREATRRRDMKAANELERLLRASDFTAATARAREYFRERTAA